MSGEGLFDKLDEQMNRMDLGSFIKFCSDFNLKEVFKVEKSEIIEVYKRVSYCHQPLSMEQYLVGLKRISKVAQE